MTRSAATALLLLAACSRPSQEARFEDLRAEPVLAERTADYEKRIVEVVSGVHVAIGFGLANSILLEGEEGLVVVDTMESVEAARDVLAAFREISEKPILALVYTHNHADHVFGAEAFAEGREIPVYAHETTSDLVDRVASVLRPVLTRRSLRMFGGFLDDAGFVNNGIGPRLAFDESSTLGLIRPNRTFRDRLEDEVGGVRFELVHAPGETEDQIFVWLPEKGVLLPGDNVYRAFPNLYTIRGTAYRDVMKWVESLDAMRARGADHLVPSHTGPVSGPAEVDRVLTDYRDAIQFVHDQTIRGMNQGLTPDELVRVVRLPAHLASSPYLEELYGKVEWSVRGIFAGNLGWFDGNPTNLLPLSPDERARRLADLAGGADRLRERASGALDAGDDPWVLELTDVLLRLDPGDETAREIRVRALTRLGERASNPNARHTYLTMAAELGQGLEIRGPGSGSPEMVRSLPMESFFRGLAVNLDPAASAEIEKRVTFVFPDSGEEWSIHLRRGVAEVRSGRLEDPDLEVRVDASVWKEMLGDLRNPALAIAKDFEVTLGSKVELVRFLGLFRPPESREDLAPD